MATVQGSRPADGLRRVAATSDADMSPSPLPSPSSTTSPFSPSSKRKRNHDTPEPPSPVSTSSSQTEEKSRARHVLAKGAFTALQARSHEPDYNILTEYTTDDLSKLNPDQLLSLWRHYDRKNVGYFTSKSKELEKLARHVVERIEKGFLDDYMGTHPGMKQSAAEKELDKERPYLMPGGGKEQSKNVSDMKAFIMRGMDVNRDGKLTEQEVKMSWNSSMGPLFVVKQEGQGAGCTTV